MGEHSEGEGLYAAILNARSPVDSGRLVVPVSSAERGVVGLDPEGRVRFMNAQAERILGLDRRRAEGMPLPEVCRHPACDAEVAHHWKAALDGVGAVSYEVEVMEEGSRYRCLVEVSVARGAGTGEVTLLLDIEQHLVDAAGRPIDHRLAFEALLSSIAMRLLSAPSEALDETIQWTLAAVGRFMHADRAYLFRFSPDRSRLTNTHEWCAPGVEPQQHRARDVPAEPFRWHLDQLERFGFVLVPCTERLPDSAAALRDELKVQGVRSMINVALNEAGRCAGFLGFDAVQAEIEWGDADVALLNATSATLGYALDRARIESELRASQADLRRAQQIAGVGTWYWQRGCDYIRCSPECAHIAGLDGPLLDVHACQARLFREDQVALKRALRRVLRRGGVLRVECRLRGAGPEEQVQRVVRILGEAERGRDGRLEAITGAVQDVSDQYRARQELSHLAHHDPLTRLPNRRVFARRLSQAIERAGRNGGRLGVFFVDLDDFKEINDRLGHARGDEMLRVVSDRLRGQLRSEDLVARYGGDEFMVLVDRIGSLRELAGIARHLIRELAKPFRLGGERLCITASVGIAVWPQDGEDADTLAVHADRAMYQAKASGRNRYCFYSSRS